MSPFTSALSIEVDIGTEFAFSPDVRSVAVISEDGYLRIIDALSER